MINIFQQSSSSSTSIIEWKMGCEYSKKIDSKTAAKTPQEFHRKGLAANICRVYNKGHMLSNFSFETHSLGEGRNGSVILCLHAKSNYSFATKSTKKYQDRTIRTILQYQ
jgi:hypothetical protein